MITYHVEKYEDCIPEIRLLIDEHYDELSVTKEYALDPHWEAYSALAKENLLQCTTCRKDGVLIGYMFFILSYNLHYRTMLMATEDLYFLKKEERKGLVGIKLFKFTEKHLKSLNVNRVIVSTKVHLDNSRLFEYLKYKFIEKTYSKLL